MSFNINLDVRNRQISGDIDLHMNAVSPLRQIVLDSSTIHISKIVLMENGMSSPPLNYLLDTSKNILGEGVVIELP